MALENETPAVPVAATPAETEAGKTTEAGSAPAEGEKPDGEKTHVQVRVRDAAGNEVYFRIKMKTKMERLMNAYCSRLGHVSLTNTQTHTHTLSE